MKKWLSQNLRVPLINSSLSNRTPYIAKRYSAEHLAYFYGKETLISKKEYALESGACEKRKIMRSQNNIALLSLTNDTFDAILVTAKHLKNKESRGTTIWQSLQSSVPV